MTTIVREAEAVWDGNLNDGAGAVGVDQASRVEFDRRSRFETRDESANPETMAAAALASCYAMTLAGQMADEGLTPAEIRVTARIVLEKKEGQAPFIPTVELAARAQVDNIKYQQYQALADSARVTCPMANLFAGAEVNLEAELFGS